MRAAPRGLLLAAAALALPPASPAQSQSPRFARLLRSADSLARLEAPAADGLRARVDRLARVPAFEPARGPVTSGFAARRVHPLHARPRPHHGVDLAGEVGAVIRAAAAGRVTAVATSPTYGRYLLVDHGGGLVTRYAHCAAILVRPGRRVARGDAIALIGNTGASSGPHLHYEVLLRGRPIDPLDFPH